MPLSRRYRFLFVSAPFSGIEVFFRNLQALLSSRDDIDCTWLWTEFHSQDLLTKIPPISMNWTLKGGLIARKNILQLEQEGKPFDAALFNHTIPAMFIHEFRNRVPILLSLDSTPRTIEVFSRWYLDREKARPEHINRIKQRFTRKVYEDAAYLLPWSSMARDSLQQDYMVPPHKAPIVPPGVDLVKWQKTHKNGEKREKENVRVLYVGNDFRRKGGDLVLRLAQRAEFRHCRFDFVSSKFEGNGGPNIVVHSGLTPNSPAILDLYDSADIFVLPTRADLAPTNAICEAMAMELPVIAANVGGLDGVVQDGTTGYIVVPNQEEQLAERLSQLVASPERRREFGRKGRQRVEASFDIRRNAETIIGYMKRAATEKEALSGANHGYGGGNGASTMSKASIGDDLPS